MARASREKQKRTTKQAPRGAASKSAPKSAVSRPRKKQKSGKTRYFDYSLLFIVIFLVSFGMLMLYSVSSYNASLSFGDPAYYLKKQLAAASIGIAFMFVVSRMDYHIWLYLAPIIYFLALGVNALVLVAGNTYSGSTRWISLGGVSFQPSEAAKVAVIIFLPYVISRAPKKMGQLKYMIRALITVVPIILLVAISNLSTAIIIAGIAIIMIFVASPKYKEFFILGGAGVGVMAVFLVMFPYRLERVKIWRHPELYDKGYQTLQGLYAIGSGGIFGKGLGESLQKLGYVPEPENDMIFSIICEELGLVGAISVLLLFILMLWRFMVIANNSSDLYGSLMVVGILAHIALQVILNVAVVTNSIPNTGITLPFISYGGTSVLILLVEMGLALAVSRGIEFESLETE